MKAQRLRKPAMKKTWKRNMLKFFPGLIFCRTLWALREYPYQFIVDEAYNSEMEAMQASQ